MTFKQPKAKRPITEVIVHCTATPEGRDVSVQTIREWHVRDRKWSDIGYHWVVLLDGTVQAGRPEALVGAHVAGHNTGTLGVVYVGGVAKDGKTPKDTRTPAQKAALLAHVKALIERYPTITKVTGHNQHAAKACPSFDVRKDDLGKLFDKPKAVAPTYQGHTAPMPKYEYQAPPKVATASACTQITPAPKPAPEAEPTIGWWQRILNSFFQREP